MSKGLNKCVFIGNVGNDPEYRVMPNSNGVCNISLAISNSWKDKTTGQKKEHTEWIRVVFFNRLAEIANEYIKKGSKIYVEGRMQTRSWEQDNVKKYITEVVGSEMLMLDSRSQDGSGYQHPQEQHQPQEHASSVQPAPTNFDNFDDDIPF